jgi:hypothetical protein
MRCKAFVRLFVDEQKCTQLAIDDIEGSDSIFDLLLAWGHESVALRATQVRDYDVTLRNNYIYACEAPQRKH